MAGGSVMESRAGWQALVRGQGSGVGRPFGEVSGAPLSETTSPPHVTSVRRQENPLEPPPSTPNFNGKVKGIFLSFKWNVSFLGPERIIYQAFAALRLPLLGPDVL